MLNSLLWNQAHRTTSVAAGRGETGVELIVLGCALGQALFAKRVLCFISTTVVTVPFHCSWAPTGDFKLGTAETVQVGTSYLSLCERLVLTLYECMTCSFRSFRQVFGCDSA